MSMQKFSLRSLRQRPGRTILTVLSIVIGVAAVVAVTVMTATTRNAYKQMFGFVTGKAALEVSTEGDGLFSQDLQAQVAQVPGVLAAAPVMQRPNVLYAGGKRVQVQLVGVDPSLDSKIRDYAIQKGEPLGEGQQILLDEVFARRLGLGVGDEAKLLMRSGGLTTMKVVGFLKPKSGNALRQAGVVLIPLKTLQRGFSVRNKINTIQLVVDESQDVGEVKARVAALLPTGVQVREPATNSQLMQETLAGSEKGLQLASVFMLVLAMFIILNTFLMNVSERRRHLAILRAIGATRRQVIRSIVVESLGLGAAGTALGIFAGLGVAWFGSLVLSMVLDVPLPATQLSPMPFFLAIIVGFTISVAGALWPAITAGRVSPLEGMSRVSQADLGKNSRVLPALGVAAIVLCTALLAATIVHWVPDMARYQGVWFGLPVDLELDVSVTAAAGVLIGMVMAYPLILVPAARLLSRMLRPWIGVEAELATRQILRHMTRSSLTTGVLFVAGSTGLAIAYSIIDNVNDVNKWADQAIIGDFFIRAMMPDMATGQSADLPEAMDAELRALPALKSIEPVSFVKGRIGEISFLAIGREFPQMHRLPFDLVEGHPLKLREQLVEGQTVVGSVLAQRNNLHVGDILEVDTTQGKRSMRIAGITNDYIGGGLSAYVYRPIGIQVLGMEGVDAYVIHAHPEQRREVAATLEAITDQHGVLLHTYADISQQINDKIVGIDGFLWVLLTIEFVVAAFGVVNTLTMNVLEQTREIGLLRIVAMTKKQVRRTIMTQAMIIGGAGLAPGVAFGVVLAWVMNMATQEALGHAVAFGFHPWLPMVTLVGAMLIVAVAAWVPAQRATRLDVVTALHYE